MMKYSDLTLANFPEFIDSRVTPVNITDTQSAIVITAAEQKINSLLGKRRDNLDYVLGQDVNVMQDTIISLERYIGPNPSGNEKTVNKRITDLESKNFDDRYPLLDHTHTINLATSVTGKLLKTNIELDNTKDGALVASDLKMWANGSGIKLTDIIFGYLPITAGSQYPVTGDLHVQGNLYSRMHCEWNACEWRAENIGYTVTSATPVTDAKSDRGALATTGLENGECVFLIKQNGNLRLKYGNYVIGLRLRLAGCTATTGLGKITATNYSRGTEVPEVPSPGSTATYDLTKDDFPSSDYEMVYMLYEHKAFANLPGNPGVCISLHWNNVPGCGTLYVDSIFVEPMHTAVYSRR